MILLNFEHRLLSIKNYNDALKRTVLDRVGSAVDNVWFDVSDLSRDFHNGFDIFTGCCGRISWRKYGYNQILQKKVKLNRTL